MLEPSDRRDRLLACLVLGGLSAGYLYWDTGPAERRCAELRSNIAALDAAIQQLPLRAAEQAHLQRQLDDRQAQRERWRPTASASATHGTVSWVAVAARRLDLRVARLEPLPGETLATGQWQLYRLSISGEFSRVLQFLQELERLEQPVHVDTLSARKTDNRAIDVEITFRIFHWPSKSPELTENTNRTASKVADNPR